MMDDDDTDAVEAESQTPGEAKADAQIFDKSALIERIVTASGLPKPQVRKILDAALVEIGTALDSGASLSLPPLGKLRPVRQSEKGGTSIHTLKLRRSPARDAKTPVSNDSDAPKPSVGSQARARVKRASSAKRLGDPADQAPAASAKKKPSGEPRETGRHPKPAGGKAVQSGASPRTPRRTGSDNADDGPDLVS